MELHQDYDYYQSWTDNEQTVEEMLVIKNKGNKDDCHNTAKIAKLLFIFLFLFFPFNQVIGKCTSRNDIEEIYRTL